MFDDYHDTNTRNLQREQQTSMINEWDTRRPKMKFCNGDRILLGVVAALGLMALIMSSIALQEQSITSHMQSLSGRNSAEDLKSTSQVDHTHDIARLDKESDQHGEVAGTLNATIFDHKSSLESALQKMVDDHQIVVAQLTNNITELKLENMLLRNALKEVNETQNDQYEDLQTKNVVQDNELGGLKQSLDIVKNKLEHLEAEMDSQSLNSERAHSVAESGLEDVKNRVDEHYLQGHQTDKPVHSSASATEKLTMFVLTFAVATRMCL